MDLLKEAQRQQTELHLQTMNLVRVRTQYYAEKQLRLPSLAPVPLSTAPSYVMMQQAGSYPYV